MTGAFSYSGGAIARQLLDRGVQVTLAVAAAGSWRPSAARARSARERLQFDDADQLAQRAGRCGSAVQHLLDPVPARDATFAGGREQPDPFRAAGRAGVRRIVHISVTNPSADSPYAYFRGKAAVERVLAEARREYAVIRPSLVFGGRKEILINNMAWLLRHLPLYRGARRRPLPRTAGVCGGRRRTGRCRRRRQRPVDARTPSGRRCTRSTSAGSCALTVGWPRLDSST